MDQAKGRTAGFGRRPEKMSFGLCTLGDLFGATAVQGRKSLMEPTLSSKPSLR